MSRQQKISAANAVIAQKLNDLDSRTFTIAEINLAVAAYLLANPATVDRPYDQIIQNTMRFYMYPDGRWISNGDDNYGLNSENANESAGTGTNPIHEWEVRGRYLKKGMNIPEYQLMGRINDVVNTPDVEIAIYFRYANLNRWDNMGLDNDNEMTNVEIYRGIWKTPVADTMGQLPFTHPVNDIHRRIYPLNFTAPEDGYFVTYIKPLRLTGSKGNDYFYGDEVIYLKFNN